MQMATVPNDFRRRLLPSSRNVDLEELRVRRVDCRQSEADSRSLFRKVCKSYVDLAE